MDRNLTIVATSGALVVVGLLISLAMVTIYKEKEIEPNPVCFSSECFRTASTIAKNMDPEINPCDNFYNFACGGYMKSAPIPDGEISANFFATLRAEIQKQLKEVIEEQGTPDEARPFRVAKDLYRACMNTSAIEELGVKSLNRILERFGKWPVIEGKNWNGDGFSWVESDYTARSLGYPVNYFITLLVGSDWKDSTKYVLMFNPPLFGLSREYLKYGEVAEAVQAYYKYMVDIAVLLGANRQRASLELKEALNFEIAMAKISLPDEKRRNFTLLYNPMTVTEMRRRFPSVNWEEYINHMLPRTDRVDGDKVVVVIEPSYISSFEKLISDTPKRVQANYLGWRVVRDSIKYLTDNLRKRELEFHAALTGVKPGNSPRWKECLAIFSKSSISLSISALYVRKYFSEEARKNALEIVTDIRNELMKILKKADWMDEQTRTRAMDKAASMFNQVGYPVEFLDDKKLEEFYADLELKPNDFHGNHRKLTIYGVDCTFNKLNRPVNKTEWISYLESTQVNAFYVAKDNSIQIPAGILHESLFNNNRPRYLNYGAIGSLIGHEVTHSFGYQGRQFDKDGNLVDWWTPETEQKYLERSQCMIDQYNNYTVPAIGLNVDGTHTLGENIADNGGVKEAYFAYKEYVKRNGREPKLPGLEYTPEQLFWIRNANVWCIKFRPETARFELTTDVHSPQRFRVIGPFSNMPEFAADFNCPLGSNMNPTRKCSVV